MQQLILEPLEPSISLERMEPLAAFDRPDDTPGWSAIFLHTASVLLGIGVAFYFARHGLFYDLPTSLLIAGLSLLMLFGPLGLICSVLTGTPVQMRNLAVGCGLIGVSLLFFGVCVLFGAAAAVVWSVARVVGG